MSGGQRSQKLRLKSSSTGIKTSFLHEYQDVILMNNLPFLSLYCVNKPKKLLIAMDSEENTILTVVYISLQIPPYYGALLKGIITKEGMHNYIPNNAVTLLVI